jgi:hypothetical protein
MNGGPLDERAPVDFPCENGRLGDAGYHLTDHRGLADISGQSATEPGGQHNKDQLDEQPGQRVLQILARVSQQRGGRRNSGPAQRVRIHHRIRGCDQGPHLQFLASFEDGVDPTPKQSSINK